MIENKEEVKPKIDLDEFIKKITVGPLKIEGYLELVPQEEQNLVIRIKEITDKYRNNGWLSDLSLQEIQTDVVVLQSCQIRLTELTSNLISAVAYSEEFMKTERSKARLKCLQQKGLFKVTAEDAKSISYAVTEEVMKQVAMYTSASNFFKYLNYSVRGIIEILDRGLSRLTRVEEIRSI